jgi:hypothetical protein
MQGGVILTLTFTPKANESPAGLGRSLRVGCMLLGYPLHNMWYNIGTIYTAIGTGAVAKAQIAQLMAGWTFVTARDRPSAVM